MHSESPDSLRVVTYNISWAVAINKVVGSEADFVDQMCIAQGDGVCRKNAIRSLNKMATSAHVYGFQEYRPWENRFAQNVSSKPGPFVLPELRGDHILTGEGTRLRSLFSSGAEPVGYMAGIQLGFYSALLTSWDKRVLGSASRTHCVNLADDPQDARPCFLAFTTRGFLVVNAHAPQPDVTKMDTVFRRIEQACKEVASGPVEHIVVMGDFNDGTRALEKGRMLFGKKLSPPGMIRTCCYDPGFGMRKGKYMFTGDYVMSDLAPISHHRVLPDGTLSGEDAVRPSVGRSDHDPVLSTFSL